MPHIFERVATHRHSASTKRATVSQEQPLEGTHKISYRPGEDFDFEASTEHAPIDVDLAMPPHRPKQQPEHHRTGMFLSSESGPISARVCRHCLNRPFLLEVVSGGASDVTVWVPSNFKGFITYTGASRVAYSPGFAAYVLPNASVNSGVPKSWVGDELLIQTGGNVSLRVWDVFSKTAEVQKKDVWKKVFGGSERRALQMQQPPSAALNWDFLLEDD